MAFLISKSETSSLSNSDQKMNLNPSEDHKDTKESLSPVSRQLYLRSSSAPTHSSTESLDKEVVLRRIRHHKCLNKLKSAFQVLGSCSTSAQGNQHRWLEQYDAFSSP